MKIMRYEVENEQRHPWREAVKTQIPTVIIATLMMLSYLAGIYVTTHECFAPRSYSIERPK